MSSDISLREQIMSDIKSAMKARKQVRLGTLRFLHAAIKNKEIELRPQPMTDEDTIGVIKKAVKQRKDSIDQFEKACRTDLVEKETAELEILNVYLPEPMSAEQINIIVNEVIKELNADSMKMMGAVMKEVITRTKGAADGKLISQAVKDNLN